MAKILFVNKSTLGGPSTSLLKLLAIVKREHDIMVLLSEDSELSALLRENGFQVVIHPVRYRSILSISCLLKKEKIDLVYANSFTAIAWRVLLAAKLAKCKFIWHIREILTVDKVNPYHVRRRVNFADQIIAVSEACYQSVILIAPERPVKVIYNGVDPDDFKFSKTDARNYIIEQFGLPSDSKLIISIGTITLRKNQLDSIKAVQGLITEDPRIHLSFLGESNPDYLDKVVGQINRLGLQSNIHFFNFRKDVNQIICGGDVVVHTALVDPHPRAVLESLAAGTPVVAYDVDGVSETILDGENGYLVPVGNLGMMEQRIKLILDDPILRERLGKAGQQTIRAKFTVEQTGEKVLKVINQVLIGNVVN